MASGGDEGLMTELLDRQEDIYFQATYISSTLLE